MRPNLGDATKVPQPKTDNFRVTLGNQLIAGLPKDERIALTANIERIHIKRGEVLREPDEEIRLVYFIESGIASILSVMSDGKSVEVGVVGNEGLVGLPIVAGIDRSPHRAVMQVDGFAGRLKADALREILRECPYLDRALQRHTHSFCMQVMQISACNRLHEVEQRMARWLLMCQDRMGGHVLALTQETIAQMLGSRRSSVTVAAGQLRSAGLIDVSRGMVVIRDRGGLQRAACECYATILKIYDRAKQNSIVSTPAHRQISLSRVYSRK